jgi:hypothetical protein
MAKETWESGTIASGSCAHRGRVLRGEGAGWEGDGSVSLTTTGYAAAVSEASSRDARDAGKRDWGATPCEYATVFLSAEGGGMRGVVVVSIVRSMSCLYCSRDLLGTERETRDLREVPVRADSEWRIACERGNFARSAGFLCLSLVTHRNAWTGCNFFMPPCRIGACCCCVCVCVCV